MTNMTSYVNNKFQTAVRAIPSTYQRSEIHEDTHIGYARVSTDEQNLSLQISALQRAGCETIFKDQGVSGITQTRPGLNSALENLSRGDTLVVWRLDRLGRSLLHLLTTISELESRGIGFRSLTENIDSQSSSGRLLFHIMGALAEFERSLIAERTRAGLAAAKASGRRLGRPPGLTLEQQASAVRAVHEGATVEKVAREYGVHRRTMFRILRREKK